MTRRAFLATVCGVPMLGTTVPALGMRAGVHLTGRLDATETELSEHTVNFGKACAIFVNDEALWTSLQPLIGPEVHISIFT